MSDLITFGRFSLDPKAYELRRGTRPVKLERLPMELLLLLLARRGAVVSRSDIVERLWGKDVFLDVESSVNTVVRKLRRALGDSAEKPRFIVTVPGRGYRFAAANGKTPATAKAVVVAVLPFENLSRDPAQDYFCDGMTEETIASLGATSPDELAVIARTSAMHYRGTTKTIRQIGKELGADFILESSIRREANRVRVTTQLVRVKDQIHQWAHSYDRDASSLLELQTELGRDIAEQIKTRIPKAGASLRRQTLNPEAFDLYLKGRFHFAVRTGEALARAISFYEQALALDAGYSLAHAGLADAYATLPITSDWRTSECREKAIPAAERAVAENEYSAEAHTSLAACQFWLTDDWDGAIQQAQRAIELNPSYPLAHFYLAHAYSNLGRHDDAEETIQRALALDPFSVHLHAIHGQMLFQAGRYEESARAAQTASGLNPDAWLGHIILGKNHLQAGDFAQAVVAFQTAFRHSGGNTEPLSLQAFALARSGQRAPAESIVREMQQTSRSRYVPPYNLAMAMNGLNQSDGAFAFLRRAAEENDVRLMFLPLDPKWKEMNREQRVRALWLKPQRDAFEERGRSRTAVR